MSQRNPRILSHEMLEGKFGYTEHLSNHQVPSSYSMKKPKEDAHVDTTGYKDVTQA